MCFGETADLYTVDMRLVIGLGLLALTPAFAQQRSTARTTLVVNVGAQCGLAIGNSTLRLDTANDTASGEISFVYRVRTSRAGGSGSVKLRVDDPGRSLNFTSTVAGAGTAPAGMRAAGSGESAVVATFTADAHSSSAGDMGTISWTMSGAYAPRWSLTIECQ
jgi:hypothetical protein